MQGQPGLQGWGRDPPLMEGAAESWRLCVPSSPSPLLPQLFPPFPQAEGTPPAQGPCPSAHQEGPCPPWAAPCWGAFEQSPDCLHAETRDAGPSMRPSELGPWASPPGQTLGEDRPEIVSVTSDCLCLSSSLSLSAFPCCLFCTAVCTYHAPSIHLAPSISAAPAPS